MSKIKIKIDLNDTNTESLVALAEGLKAFAYAAFSAAESVLPPPPKAEIAPTPKVAPTPKAKVAPTPKAEVAPTPKAEVAPTPKAEVAPTPKAEANAGVTLKDIRMLMSEKVADHVETLRAQLGELGANNVSALKPAHYESFYEYLNTLD